MGGKKSSSEAEKVLLLVLYRHRWLEQQRARKEHRFCTHKHTHTHTLLHPSCNYWTQLEVQLTAYRWGTRTGTICGLILHPHRLKQQQQQLPRGTALATVPTKDKHKHFLNVSEKTKSHPEVSSSDLIWQSRSTRLGLGSHSGCSESAAATLARNKGEMSLTWSVRWETEEIKWESEREKRERAEIIHFI